MFGVGFSYAPNVCFVSIMPQMWNVGVNYTLTSIFFGPKSYFGPSSLLKVLFWSLKSPVNFPVRYTAAPTTTKTPNLRFFDLLSLMAAFILRINDQKYDFRRLCNFLAACQSFFHKMEAAIKLRRARNLRLEVFVVVGAAVYLAEKFTGDFRDQNGTLSKLEGPK